jgi:hypothetical protein
VRRFGSLRPVQIWVISALTFLMVGMEAVTSALAMDHARVQPDTSGGQWSASNFAQAPVAKHLPKKILNCENDKGLGMFLRIKDM